jgi:L-cystine uptake protein TcyP (sodium:dicarboxylate symporter family)
MIPMLLNLLILCIIFGLIFYVLDRLPLTEPFGQLAKVAVLVIFLMILVAALLGLVPPSSFGLR